MDALDMLISDHRLVDGLFNETTSTNEPNKLKQLQERIISELSTHAAVEEMVRIAPHALAHSSVYLPHGPPPSEERPTR